MRAKTNENIVTFYFVRHGETLFSLEVNASAPEGVTYAQLFSRTQEVVREIVSRHSLEGENILVISYGVTIGNYIVQMTNSKECAVHDNCCVSVVSYKNGLVGQSPTIKTTGMRFNNMIVFNYEQELECYLTGIT